MLFHVGVRKVYRTVARLPFDASDEAVITELAMPVPKDLLMQLRICTCIRMMNTAPKVLLLLLGMATKCKRSWLHAVKADIHYLRIHSKSFRNFVGAVNNPPSHLVMLAQSQGTDFKRFL